MLHLSESFGYLRFYVESSGDTTLALVNRATGNVYCDDDSGAGDNFALAFWNMRSGVYEVRIGSYSWDDMLSYELMLTEYDDAWLTPITFLR